MAVSRKAVHVTRFVLIILSIIWMAYIFSFSAEKAEHSAIRSNNIALVVADSVSRIFPLSDKEKTELAASLEGLIRKCAHMYLYAVLAVLLCGVMLTFELKNILRISVSFVFCVLYAASDETHQLFIDGRSGEVRDVLIDACGAALGLGTVFLMRFFMKKAAEKRYLKKTLHK